MDGPALTAGQFTFKLYAADDYWNPVGTDALTATNDADGNFVFSNKLAGSTNYILNKAPFVVDKAGTYRFLMMEDEGTDANIRYDAAQYRIEVEVEDKGDGTLAVKKTSYFKATVVDGTLIEGEADQNGVKFVNIYVPDEIKITIEGEKILTDYKGNKVALGDKVFRFEVYETGADYAVAEGTLSVANTANDANGDFAFELPIGQKGNKYYVIRESDESAYADINNDPTEFHVMVQVSLGADGKLSASKPVIKVGDKEHELKFVNTYDRPEPAKLMVELDVQKDLVNQNAYGKDLSGFKFELVNAENKVVDTAESDAKGKATLYAAEFAMSDVGKTFTYTVREVNTGISGMVYSTHQYKVEITIGYDSESNSLFATVKKDGVALQKGETFKFTNIYNPPYYPNYPDEPERDPDRPSSPKTGEESSWPWIMMLSIGIMGLAVTTACLFAKPRKARR